MPIDLEQLRTDVAVKVMRFKNIGCDWRGHLRGNLEGRSAIDIPDYARSLDACRKVEAEIERRGPEVQQAYAIELCRLRAREYSVAAQTFWTLATAPAEVRCRAALAAVASQQEQP